MSLILEALKKSEAERRLGETPNLGTMPGWAPPRRSSRGWWMLLPVGLIVIAAGWSNRDLLGGKPVASDDESVSDASSKRSSARAANPGDRAGEIAADDELAGPASARRDEGSGPTAPFARRDGAQMSSAQPVRPMPDPVAFPAGGDAIATVDTATAEAAAPVASGPMSRDEQMAREATKMMERSDRLRAQRDAQNAAIAAQQAMATPPPSSQPAPDKFDPAQDNAIVDGTVPAPSMPTPTYPSMPPPVQQPTSPAPVLSSNGGAIALTLNDLTLGQRQGLPPLKMSVHFYNKDPTRRFVIIDGARLNEGGALGADVYARQIMPDGVMIEYHGVQFLLPRIGG